MFWKRTPKNLAASLGPHDRSTPLNRNANNDNANNDNANNDNANNDNANNDNANFDMNPNSMNPDNTDDTNDMPLPADAETAANAAETTGEAEPLSDDPAVLRALLADAKARAETEHEAFLRARADFANFKRRTEEERESMKTFLSEKMLKSLLPITDNFDRALLASETTKDYDKLIGGINAVYRQLAEFLAREGVEVIDALHKPFDPNLHDAVMREETTEYPDNTVVAELQKGYTIGGRVLRPTMVRVSTGTE